MMTIKMTGKLLTSLSLFTLLVLGGCADDKVRSAANPVTNNKPVDSNLTAANKTNSTDKTVVVPSVKRIDYTTVNPVVIEFDKLSVELTDENKQILLQIVDRAKKSQNFTITGYCDYRQVGNAQAAAIKRASRIKEQLTALGVTAPMRIKYSTQKIDKHAAEIEF